MRHVFNVVMRVVSSLVGLLMVAMGSIWIMQGLGVGPSAILQGFMVNDIRWAFYGALLAVVGIAEIAWSNMRQTTG
jgi:ABC-type lipoprotein release transport system permease subunit